jgi:hypothetical protein
VLARAHARDLFRPTEPRQAARRVVELGDRLGLDGRVFRGVVDLGHAEIDHVWAVIDGRVVDPALPLFAPGFVDRLRAYVAGDIDARALERAAHPYSVRWRVVGAYPREHRYLGRPVWSGRVPHAN